MRERVCMCVLHLTRRIGHLKVGCTSSLTRCTAREGLEVAANMSGNAVLSRTIFIYLKNSEQLSVKIGRGGGGGCLLP